MSKYWMITNRNVTGSGLGKNRVDELSFFTAKQGPLRDFQSWTKQRPQKFRQDLIAAADRFPLLGEGENEAQKHVTLFVHGYNTNWSKAAARYQQICDDLYGAGGLGLCVLFTWPSNGETAHYLSDREDARSSGPDLARVFNSIFEQARLMQNSASEGEGVCKAKISVIAHSMGNWVFQNALARTWERHNKPLTVSLINQCIMVAADVDNDLFADGETVGNSSAEGIANLCYRITALYSGLDSVLGVSAGLKHFGKRRLGRSGLDKKMPVPDNVWDFDCSPLFSPGQKNIHSAYFETRKIQELMRTVLQGHDRLVVESKFK